MKRFWLLALCAFLFSCSANRQTSVPAPQSNPNRFSTNYYSMAEIALEANDFRHRIIIRGKPV
ncbi:MAG TPA: hypothetical protein PLD62_07770, partial [Candidatus Cloacimonadota bacterium]|nr:hypothetical protein [Candidatus Cloacimonadota bacterium]